MSIDHETASWNVHDETPGGVPDEMAEPPETYDRRTFLDGALTLTRGVAAVAVAEALLPGCTAHGPYSHGNDHNMYRTDPSATAPEMSRTPRDIEDRHENATTVAITIADGIIKGLERTHRGRRVLRDRQTGDVSAWTEAAETVQETGKPKIEAEWRGSSSVFSGSYHTTLAEQKRRHGHESADGDDEASVTVSTSIRYNGALTDIPKGWTMSDLLDRWPDRIVVDEIQFQADQPFIDALDMPTDGTPLPKSGRLVTDAKSPIEPVVNSKGVIVGWNKVVGDIVGHEYTDELYVLAEYLFGDPHHRPKDADPGTTGS